MAPPIPTHDPDATAVRERAADLLTAWAAISSPSGDLPGLERMAQALTAAFSAVGLRCRTLDLAGDGQPVFFAHGPAIEDPQQARHTLLAVGHLDTVLPAVPPRREGDRLHATGAVDMKAGLAAFWGALCRLHDRGLRPPADTLLVVVPDEEVGGDLSHRVMRELGPRAREIWVLEPGDRAGADRETLVIGRRGLFTWQLDVRGRGAHAGNAFWSGRSALAAATAWTTAARDLAQPGSGPTVNPARLVAGDASFVEQLATMAPLVGSPRQLNVVPDRAIVEGEARFLRASEEPDLRARLADLATEIATSHEVATTFTVTSRIPPLDPAGASSALAVRAQQLAAARGWRLELETDRGGISFPNMLPDPSAVPILDGLGPVGGGMHTRGEWVDLGSLGRRIELLADLLAG